MSLFQTLDDACFLDYLRKGIRHSPQTQLREDVRQILKNLRDAVPLDVRFNPYHDPENGQFTFAPNNAGAEHWPERGKSALNVDEAVKYAMSEAKSSSIGQCAKYVRRALEAGGVFIKNHPTFAKDYGPHLEKGGFHKLSPRPKPDYDPQKGDVVVIQNHTQGGAGHIAIFNGKHWVSDFVQPRNDSFWPGPPYREHKPPYEVYRP
jgi:hypothetical protein